MEEQADYIEYSDLYQVRSPEPFFNFLDQWQKQVRLVAVQANQEQGIVTGLVLERLPSLTPELAATRLPKLGAYMMLVGDTLRLWHTDAAALGQIARKCSKRWGRPCLRRGRNAVPPTSPTSLPRRWSSPSPPPTRRRRSAGCCEHIERFFEEKWIHRPLQSLNRIPPLDAAGHAMLRKKLVGVVQFLQECAAGGQVQSYDFDRLRRKLGLLPDSAAKAAPAAAGQHPDLMAMSAGELAGLQSRRAGGRATGAGLPGRPETRRPRAGRPFCPFPGGAAAAHANRPDRYPWYCAPCAACPERGEDGRGPEPGQ